MTTYTPRFQFPVPDFNVAPWHTIMATTLNMVDSAIYNTLASQLVWGVSTTYPAGQVVIDPSTGLLWTALLPHTSGTGTFAADRAANPTYWQLTLQTTAINSETPVDVASDATVNLGGVTPTRVNITGTTTITSFGNAANTYKFVRFTGALTLTHNGTSLILPGGASILTAAEDWAIFASDASGNWRCISYQTNTTISAAPLDALAYNGMQINGGIVVSQINADAAVTGITNTPNKVIDAWTVSNAGDNVVSAQRIGGTAPTGFTQLIRTTITTADAALGAGDFLSIYQKLEGTRTSRLSYGAASALPSSYGFWVRCSITGTFGFSVRNSALDRSYVTTFAIAAANTWEFKTFTIPGDTTGTWLTGGVGLWPSICMMSGTSQQTTAGSWQAGSFLTTSAQTNLAATNGATFDVTGFVALPGTNLPTSDRIPMLMRPYSDELLLVQRSLLMLANTDQEFIASSQNTSTTVSVGTFRPPVEMRATPTLGLSAASHFAVTAAAGTAIALTDLVVTSSTGKAIRLTSTVAAGLVAGNASILFANSTSAKAYLDARL